MKIGLILIVIVALVFFCAFRENYTHKNFLNQWYAKGSIGTDYTGSPKSSYYLGGKIPKTFIWSGLTESPDSQEMMLSQSMYSTKVWPTTYQPVTNTCYDEYMRACTPPCSTRDCVEKCQLNGSKNCSKKKNIPEMISHSI